MSSFAYEEQLRAWRQEIEATLAFAPLEIHELEDHLALSFEAKVREGVPPEQAWVQAVAGIGSSRTLALEFAKNKLLPALLHLLGSWGRSAALLALFISTAVLGFTYFGPSWRYSDDPGHTATTGIAVALSGSLIGTIILVLTLLRQKERNAVLVGIGNSVCLFPILYGVVYNSLGEEWVTPGWAQMGASFASWHILLAFGGLGIINGWWRRYSLSRKCVSLMSCLVFLLTVAPFFGEVIGNLTLLTNYHLPPAHPMRYRSYVPDASVFSAFTHELTKSFFFISNVVPLGLSLFLCLMVIGLQIGGRSAGSSENAFPSRATVPTLTVFLALAVNWALSHFMEVYASRALWEIGLIRGRHNPFHGGFEITVLLSAVGFILCQADVTKRMRSAAQVSPFYALLVVMVGGLVGIIMPCSAALLLNASASFEPGWLSMLLEFPVLVMTFYQAGLIWRKASQRETQISLWQFKGSDLVRNGLLFGFVLAGIGLVWMMMMVLFSLISTVDTDALLQYLRAVRDQQAFNPELHIPENHLANWVFYSVIYLSTCMAAGLGLVMAMSGLEFIRFNSLRLYKMRSMRLAVN